MSNLIGKELLDKDINLDYWVALQKIDKCFYGCKKFKEPLYVCIKDKNGKETEARVLNPKYMAHLKMTHGFPPTVAVDEIAENLYYNTEDKQKMRELYSYLED